MIEVIIIGGGNVARHLAQAILESDGIQLVQIYNRTLQTIEDFKNKTSITDHIKALKKAGIYIICVSDQAIAGISEQLPQNNSLVVHTAGGVDMEILNKHRNMGVFYPLQSFSKDRKINFNEVPIGIEANTPENEALLQQLADGLQNKYFLIDSNQRKKLHIAAVFVNNFVNHLYYIGQDICKKNNLDPAILNPLIQETAQKTVPMNPLDAQTGPARRGDTITVKNHLKKLTGINKEIYKLLSQSIADTYGKKL